MKPSITPLTVFTLSAGLLALAVGGAIGSLRSPTPSAIAKPQNANAPSTGLGTFAAPSTAAAPVIEASAIEEIQSATGARRWLLLLSAAEKATAADMPELIRSVRLDSTAVRMLAARWAELDPKHMFSSIYADSFSPESSAGALPFRYDLGSVLFEEWTKRDFAGAVKALTDAPEFSARENFRMSVVSAAMKLDVEAGLKVMRDWNIRSYFPDMKKLTEWAARDPQHAAETVLKLGGDYSSQQALREVGKAWAQTDPEGGLRYAAKLDPASRATLSAELIRQWADQNVNAAAAFAASQTDLSFRAALGQSLVATWGRTDPRAALAWSTENLRGTSRNEAIAGLVRSAAEQSLTAASELVADMEPGGAQNRACASIFETWFNKGKGERAAAFDWLTSLPDPEARRSAFERVQWNWAYNDPEGAREFLTGPYAAMASDQLISQVARTQAAKNPEEAMKWAATLPGTGATAARSAVLQNWLSIRPEAAATYVRSMPASAEREGAIRTVISNMLQQSPQQAGEWLRTLPSADQALALQTFERQSWSSDQRKAFDQALKR